MGNVFGGMPQNGFNLYFHPDDTPHPFKIPANDPLEGFPNGRRERVADFTDEEVRSAKIKHRHRDYCAGELLKFRACRKDVWPFAVLCSREKHAYLRCQHEDYVLRMKEYERERRMKRLAECTCFDGVCTCEIGDQIIEIEEDEEEEDECEDEEEEDEECEDEEETDEECEDD